MSTITKAAALLPLLFATQSFGGANQAMLACMEKVAPDTKDATGYIFTEHSNANLFSEEEQTASGAPTFIYVVTGTDSLANLISPETLDGPYQWTGIGSRTENLARVKVLDDKKVYQFDLSTMQGTVIQGYRPVAQLECLVQK